MARGCSAKMTATIAASARAGSRMRSCPEPRRHGRRAGAVPAGVGSAASERIGAALAEGGADHPLLADRAARDLVGNAAAIEDVDAVAIDELVVLGRVPDEAAAALRLAPDMLVELALGADIDAAQRVVEQHDLGLAGEGARDQRLLLVAAA